MRSEGSSLVTLVSSLLLKMEYRLLVRRMADAVVVLRDEDKLDRRLADWREDWRVVCIEGDVIMEWNDVDAGDFEALDLFGRTMMSPAESGAGCASLRNGGVWCWDEPDTINCCLDGVVTTVASSDAGSAV